MEKTELELFYDKYIANDAEVKEEAEVNKLDEVEEESVEAEFFRLLPDELLTLSSQKNTENPNLKDSQKDSKAVPCGSFTMESIPQPVLVIPPKPQAEQLSIKPQIMNVLSSVNLGCPLDLHFIAANAWNVEYDKKKYDVVIMRIRRPQATANIYKTGKMVCSGTQSEDQARVAARRFARILQKLGFSVCFLNFTIHNMMASGSTFPICLQRMAIYPNTSYEPELSPSLLFKVMPGVSINIFPTGRMILTGAKCEADVQEAFKIALPGLIRFRKKKCDE